MSKVKNFNVLPKYYELAGLLAGSQQPGYANVNPPKDLNTLKKLKALTNEQATRAHMLKGCGVDKELIDDLKYIRSQGIQTIYSLADFKKDRNPELVKFVWEHLFKDTEYI